jgi:hypothetical protein
LLGGVVERGFSKEFASAKAVREKRGRNELGRAGALYPRGGGARQARFLPPWKAIGVSKARSSASAAQPAAPNKERQI